MAVKKGLGRGLDILIPRDAGNSVKKTKEKSDFKDNDQKIRESTDIVKDNKEIDVKKDVEKSNRIEQKFDNTLETNENNKVTKKTASETKSSSKKDKSDNEVLMMDINRIEPNINQPRKLFDEDSLKELADSIKKNGMISPIIVAKKDNYYEIIAGERRWRASRLAGLKKVPVLIKDYKEEDILKIALIENIQRENLNPIEEAKAYEELKSIHGLKQEEIAESVSKSRAAVANSLRLLKLDERVQELILTNKLSNGHGRTLLSISDGDIQYEMASMIIEKELSVRETEKLVKEISTEKDEHPEAEKNKEENKTQKKEAMILYYEDRMREILGSKVTIKNNKKNKGRIEIEYYSLSELERIIDMVQSLDL